MALAVPRVPRRRVPPEFAEQCMFDVPPEFSSENDGVNRRNQELAWTFGEIALVQRDIFNFTYRPNDPTRIGLVMMVWDLKTAHMKLRAKVRALSREIFQMGAEAIPEPSWFRHYP